MNMSFQSAQLSSYFSLLFYCAFCFWTSIYLVLILLWKMTVLLQGVSINNCIRVMSLVRKSSPNLSGRCNLSRSLDCCFKTCSCITCMVSFLSFLGKRKSRICQLTLVIKYSG
ncbi:hypothetical protein POPTR_002G023950v4 [Populus trichocarpa]|uniref:Uncharacterized protein n=1 Tax=Populus trichocarpa TaxID=3694 RepID=A0ACC0TBM7_POPTR|nr:hypothetical protein POPTR_002G023950v4 [Populus trichocarpa]